MTDAAQHYFERPHCDIALKPRDAAGLEALGFSAREVLGRGAFALVFGVRDGGGRSLAVKKVFLPRDGGSRVALQRGVPAHPNVLRLLDSFERDESLGSGRVAYEVFEKFDLNLEQLIRHFRQRKLPFPPGLLSHVARSLLSGLDHLHSAGVIHRDLKPSNVLLKFRSSGSIDPGAMEEGELFGYHDASPGDVRVVVSDLGHAITAGAPRSTSYVSTRFYRAPELLLGFLHYSFAVDLWALGCLIAELVRLRPLFHGDSGTAVLGRILLTLGNPDPHLVERYTNEKIPLAQAKGTACLESRVHAADPKILALVKALLVYDDAKRLTPHEALKMLSTETPFDKF